MLRLGADPDAWFGLEAAPGFALVDSPRAPFQRPAVARSGAGYLPGRPPMDAGLVAFGAGLRQGVRIPEMEQADVAPTLLRLLGLELPEADGRALVGVLRPARVAAEGPEGGD